MICRRRGYDKDRACFRFHSYQDVQEVKPTEGRYGKTGRKVALTKAAAWLQVIDMEDWWPEQDVLENVLFADICPTGMMGNDMEGVYELEGVCKEYHTQPAGPSVDDWPARTYDAFMAIRRAHNEMRKDKPPKGS